MLPPTKAERMVVLLGSVAAILLVLFYLLNGGTLS